MWQLYIEELDGARTHIYARFLPFGLLEARLADTAESQPLQLLLIEQMPDQLAV